MSKFLAACAAAFCLAVVAVPAAAIPPGSYQQTCKDIKFKDPDGESARLQARCIDRSGEWRKTSFDLDRCWGDLANIDGELVCVADQRHGGAGFQDQYAQGHGQVHPPPGYPPQGYPPQGYPPQGYPPQGYPPQGAPGYHPPHSGKPKDVAVDVCVERAVSEAYRSGAGFARLLRIEDVDRKDAGRIKVKGVVLASENRESRHTHDMPFRCDSRQGQILQFKWR